MVRKVVAWGVIVLLLIASALAVGLGHSWRRQADEAVQVRSLVLWFEASGAIQIDGHRSRPARWQDAWRLALGLDPRVSVRVGADDGVPFALVHEAFAEAWRQHVADVGYAVDQDGQELVLSRLARADLQPPGPHVLSVEADGRMALDDTPVDERAVGEWLKLSAAPGYPRGAGTLVELKVDQDVSYGSIRRLLAMLAASGPRRIADSGQSAELAREWLPPPPVQPIPLSN